MCGKFLVRLVQVVVWEEGEVRRTKVDLDLIGFER